MSNQVINLDTRRPHKISEVICVKCLHRWIAVRPDATNLKELECPGCAFIGAAIETGEIVEEWFSTGLTLIIISFLII